MAHESPLITAIVMGIGLAFLFGALANRLRISPLVGYLLAGVIAGPNTPGLQADPNLTNQLAEIGIILLMFGVGLHFSLKDLLSVKTIAIPGAIVQMIVATLLGTAFGLFMGWSPTSGMVFGLALSTASTVVLLRAIQERRLIESERGRIAIGWLIIEDITMVLALVLLPTLATSTSNITNSISWAGILTIISITIAKASLFVTIMMVVGRRFIPWLLKVIAQTGSRELFSLSVLAIALGVALSAADLFGVSLALGAFFAGMIMSESEFGHRATEETLPLRDAFAVLFFVSVGMLFNPIKVVRDCIPLLSTLSIIIIGKSVIAFLIVRAFHRPIRTALTISASLAQIGEFSFILAGFGNRLGILNDNARDLILGGAILSILLNPLVFLAADKIRQKLESTHPKEMKNDPLQIIQKNTDEQLFISHKTDHTIIIGFSQIGQLIATDLNKYNIPIVVVEDIERNAEKARCEHFETISGNAVHEDILAAANIDSARYLVLTMENTFEAGQIVSIGKRHNKNLHILAHVESDAEGQYLCDLGADVVIANDRQIANGIIDFLIEKQNLPEKKEIGSFSEEERTALS